MCNQQAGGGQHTIIKSDWGESESCESILDEGLIHRANPYSLHNNHVRFLIFEWLSFNFDHARIRRRALARS